MRKKAYKHKTKNDRAKTVVTFPLPVLRMRRLYVLILLVFKRFKTVEAAVRVAVWLAWFATFLEFSLYKLRYRQTLAKAVPILVLMAICISVTVFLIAFTCFLPTTSLAGRFLKTKARRKLLACLDLVVVSFSATKVWWAASRTARRLYVVLVALLVWAHRVDVH